MMSTRNQDGSVHLFCKVQRGLVVPAAAVLFLSLVALPATAGPKSVALPELPDGAIPMRVAYIENPRFAAVSEPDMQVVLRTATDLVAEHFGIALETSGTIVVRDIDTVFAYVVPRAREGFDDMIGDFRGGKVDWERVREIVIEEIELEEGSLPDQTAFA